MTGINGGIKTGLSKTQIDILKEIRNDPKITTSKLMEKLSLGETTIESNISLLKKNKYLKRIGSKKYGFWKITK
jgi:ATP-dependent DNA helicase RecG